MYEVKKALNKTFKVEHSELDFTERWVFECYLLGYKDVNDYFNFLLSLDANILRESYNDSSGRFTHTGGFQILFKTKDSADKYASALNTKIEKGIE